MYARAARVLKLALPLLLLAWSPAALADLLPSPERPPWNEEPPPMPQPRPEEDEESSALFAVAAALAAGAWAMSRHRRLRPPAATRPRAAFAPPMSRGAGRA
jgi:hypothetical protein